MGVDFLSRVKGVGSPLERSFTDENTLYPSGFNGISSTVILKSEGEIPHTTGVIVSQF
jgi:hypothetical protein